MAVRIARSMNGELEEGMTDGSYRKPWADTAGGSPSTLQSRRNLSQQDYLWSTQSVLPETERHLPDASQ